MPKGEARQARLSWKASGKRYGSRKESDVRATDGRSRQGRERGVSIAGSHAQQRRFGNRPYDDGTTGGASQAALGIDQGQAFGRDLCTHAGSAGRNTQAGWGDTNAGDTYGAGQMHPADGVERVNLDL